MQVTRNELINDLGKAHKDQNDIDSMDDDKLLAFWKRFGIHSGTWDEEITISDEVQ